MGTGEKIVGVVAALTDRLDHVVVALTFGGMGLRGGGQKGVNTTCLSLSSSLSISISISISISSRVSLSLCPFIRPCFPLSSRTKEENEKGSMNKPFNNGRTFPHQVHHR